MSCSLPGERPTAPGAYAPTGRLVPSANDGAVETSSAYASNIVDTLRSDTSRVARTRNSIVACRVVSFSSEGADVCSFGELLDVQRLTARHFQQALRLEGMDHIDLEALRAETKPAWKGPNFG